MFGQEFFLSYCWKPKGFFYVLIFAPIPSSPSPEIWSTPPGPCREEGIFHHIYKFFVRDE